MPGGRDRILAKCSQFAGAHLVHENNMGEWRTAAAAESHNDGEVVSNHGYEDPDINHEAATLRAVSKTENLSPLKRGGRRISSGKSNERQKITRACDACKVRKSRCTGTIPCHRCSRSSIPCKYDSPHRRGQPSSPPRHGSIALDAGSQPVLFASQAQQTLPPPGEMLTIPPFESRPPDRFHETFHSSSSSPGRDATNVEGQYIGPTSGLAFLHRAKGRLRKDFSSSTRNAVDVPRGASSIFTFGDKPHPDVSALTLVLPSRQQAREHAKRYFEFAVPTYRFLHEGTLEGWLEKFMDEAEMTGNISKRLSDGKAAAVLMVLATSMLYRVDDAAAFHDTEVDESDQR
jgi:hypothetical protein